MVVSRGAQWFSVRRDSEFFDIFGKFDGADPLRNTSERHKQF
jgi:hypothetical protein